MTRVTKKKFNLTQYLERLNGIEQRIIHAREMEEMEEMEEVEW